MGFRVQFPQPIKFLYARIVSPLCLSAFWWGDSIQIDVLVIYSNILLTLGVEWPSYSHQALAQPMNIMQGRVKSIF